MEEEKRIAQKSFLDIEEVLKLNGYSITDFSEKNQKMFIEIYQAGAKVGMDEMKKVFEKI